MTQAYQAPPMPLAEGPGLQRSIQRPSPKFLMQRAVEQIRLTAICNSDQTGTTSGIAAPANSNCLGSTTAGSARTHRHGAEDPDNAGSKGTNDPSD